MSGGVVVFVTGASRGLGRALAVAFARGFASSGVTIVCLARDAAGLAGTAAAVRAASPGAAVVEVVADLGAVASLDGSWAAATSALAASSRARGAAPPRRAILVHNAGSLGPLGPLRGAGAPASAAAAAAYVELNFTSPAWLTTLFLRGLEGPAAFVAPPPPAEDPPGAAGTGAAAPALPHHLIVNISSLVAVRAMPTWSLYAATRAGRDMLTAVVGAEEAARASGGGGGGGGGGGVAVKTLSWAPGPCDTDMQRECRESDALDADSRDHLRALWAAGAIVDPADSAAKCVRTILRNDFASGAHIDFYDAEERAV